MAALRATDDAVLRRVPDAVEAGRTAALHVLSEAVWSAELGPFYDVVGVRRLLGRSQRPLSKQAVSKRRDLLALRTRSGRVVYPAFQFDGHATLSGLRDVLDRLRDAPVSPWTVASWLTSPASVFGGRSPAQTLRAGQVQAVVAEATDWSRSLHAA